AEGEAVVAGITRVGDGTVVDVGLGERITRGQGGDAILEAAGGGSADQGVDHAAGRVIRIGAELGAGDGRGRTFGGAQAGVDQVHRITDRQAEVSGRHAYAIVIGDAEGEAVVSCGSRVGDGAGIDVSLGEGVTRGQGRCAVFQGARGRCADQGVD